MKARAGASGRRGSVRRGPSVRDLALVSLFAALTAVGALLRIPLPPVPFTLQIFFALLAGLLLGARRGAASQIVYALLGLVGLPVFAGGGGWQYVLTPGFGYVLGFVAAAAVAGAVAGGAKTSPPRQPGVRLLAAGFLGLAACYAVGLPYFFWILNSVQGVPTAASTVVSRGLLVFLPWDVPKVLLAAAVAGRVRPLLLQAS